MPLPLLNYSALALFAHSDLPLFEYKLNCFVFLSVSPLIPAHRGQGQRQVPNLNLATPFLIVGQVQVRLGLRYYFSCLRLG